MLRESRVGPVSLDGSQTAVSIFHVGLERAQRGLSAPIT
jgi:hypothetical protein